MTCDQDSQIHAYYDGALDAAGKRQVETHLSQCAQCRELLEDLRGLSEMFATVPLPEMPAGAVGRMYGTWWNSKQAQERGIRRVAGLMAAAAAVVMVIVPLFGSPVVPADNQGIAWEARGFIAPSVPRDDPNADLIQVAQWMANDLSEMGQ
jgi:anti-sigma factor RsiW